MDTTTSEHPPLAAERVALPSDYADCHDIAEANETYRALWQIATDTGLDPFTKEARPIVAELQENHRKAMVYFTGRITGKTGAPREKRTPVIHAKLSDDGMTITCAGPCGETKSIKKFPTISGSPGVREATCRECKDAAKKGGAA